MLILFANHQLQRKSKINFEAAAFYPELMSLPSRSKFFELLFYSLVFCGALQRNINIASSSNEKDRVD